MLRVKRYFFSHFLLQFHVLAQPPLLLDRLTTGLILKTGEAERKKVPTVSPWGFTWSSGSSLTSSWTLPTTYWWVLLASDSFKIDFCCNQGCNSFNKGQTRGCCIFYNRLLWWVFPLKERKKREVTGQWSSGTIAAIVAPNLLGPIVDHVNLNTPLHDCLTGIDITPADYRIPFAIADVTFLGEANLKCDCIFSVILPQEVRTLLRECSE